MSHLEREPECAIHIGEVPTTGPSQVPSTVIFLDFKFGLIEDWMIELREFVLSADGFKIFFFAEMRSTCASSNISCINSNQ